MNKIKIKKYILYFLLMVLAYLFVLLYLESIKEPGHVVAVIDTGVDAEHELLKGKVIKGFDFLDFDRDTSDDNGHGTHVAGIIVSQSPKAKILPIRILGKDGYGSGGSNLAILYAILKGADVVNMSFALSDKNFITEFIINFGSKKGVIFVAATGNEGEKEISYPAKYKNVLAIGTSDTNNNLFEGSNIGEGLDFLAPGVSIKSADLKNTYSVKTGTSLSSAYASGLISFLLTEKNHLKKEEVLSYLQETSNRIYLDRDLKILDKEKLIAKEKDFVYMWMRKPERYTDNNKIDFELQTMNVDEVKLIHNGVNQVLRKKKDVNEIIEMNLEDGTHEFALIAKRGDDYHTKHFAVTVDNEMPEIKIKNIKIMQKDYYDIDIVDDSLKEVEIENRYGEKVLYVIDKETKYFDILVKREDYPLPMKITAKDKVGNIFELNVVQREK